MTNIVIYTKQIKDTKNNKTFDKYMISYNGKRFEAIVTKKAQEDIIRANQPMPLALTLEESDYFMKRKYYTRNDNTKGMKYVLVLKSFQSAQHTEFKNVTLDDVCAELDSQVLDPIED